MFVHPIAPAAFPRFRLQLFFSANHMLMLLTFYFMNDPPTQRCCVFLTPNPVPKSGGSRLTARVVEGVGFLQSFHWRCIQTRSSRYIFSGTRQYSLAETYVCRSTSSMRQDLSIVARKRFKPCPSKGNATNVESCEPRPRLRCKKPSCSRSFDSPTVILKL